MDYCSLNKTDNRSTTRQSTTIASSKVLKVIYQPLQKAKQRVQTAKKNLKKFRMIGRLHSVSLLVALFGLTSIERALGFVAPQPAISRAAATNTQVDFQIGWKSSSDESAWQLSMSASDKNEKSQLPFWLDPGTKGGAIFLSLVAFIVPIIFYNIVTNVFNVDGVQAGIWIGGGFTVVATLGWVSSYLFRVATKDMTYVSTIAA